MVIFVSFKTRWSITHASFSSPTFQLVYKYNSGENTRTTFRLFIGMETTRFCLETKLSISVECDRGNNLYNSYKYKAETMLT